MIVKTKIDVHVGMLLVEFSDNPIVVNIFEVVRHPTEDPSLFGIDIIDDLVVENMQLEAVSAEFSNFAKDIDVIGCLGSVTDESDYNELLEYKIFLTLRTTSATNDASPLHSPPIELKLLAGHLKYAYLDNDQQFPVIIANNLYQEQEEKLLQVLRQHKKAIGWQLLDLLGINH
ncbi:hypothetical protein CR513_15210, partial [Mucuna pruriens]